MGLIVTTAVGPASPPALAQAGEGRYCTREEFNAFLNTLKPVEDRLTLSLAPSQASYSIGEQVRISVTSPVAGDLLLISIDSEGVAIPIFPNAHQADNGATRVEANETLSLPQEDQGFAFETQGPEGPSRVVAIVRPTGRQLPLACATPLTRGRDITLGDKPPGREVPSPLPKVFEGWAYAAFDYTVTLKPPA